MQHSAATSQVGVLTGTGPKNGRGTTAAACSSAQDEDEDEDEDELSHRHYLDLGVNASSGARLLAAALKGLNASGHTAAANSQQASKSLMQGVVHRKQA
jgi:hypothetical protein